MAVTLKVRAGTALRRQLRYWNPTKTELIDTTGLTARLQLRALQRPGRVLMNVNEYVGSPVPVGTPFWRVAPGHWSLFLDGAVTMSLPQSVRFEIELVNNTNPNDAYPLVFGTINVDPQVMSNA